MKIISKMAYNINFSDRKLIDYVNPIINKVVENKKYFMDGYNKVFVLSQENYKIAVSGNDLINR